MPSRALAELFFHFWIQIANREHAHSESPLNDNLTHVHSLHALRHRMVLRPTILTGHTLTSDRGGMLGAYLAFETDWQPHDHKRKPQYPSDVNPERDPLGMINGEGVITGTVVSSAVIAAAVGHLEETRLVIAILATAFIYWLAHLHARTLGDAVKHRTHPVDALKEA